MAARRWYARFAGVACDRQAMNGERYASPGAEVPGLFALGLFVMLLLPLVFALCAASFCFRQAYGGKHAAGSKACTSEMLSPEESDSEEAALHPSRRDSDSSFLEQIHSRRPSNRLTPVIYRNATGWCSCARRPLTSKVALEHVNSLPELHEVLKLAYSHASGREQGAAGQSLNLTVEYRNAHAKLVRLSRETDLKELSGVKALYVTTKAIPLADSGSVAASNTDVDRGNTSEEEDCDNLSIVSSDAASSVVTLVDLSLAGCCGVQSNCGGLVINGHVPHVEGSGKRKGRLRPSISRPHTTRLDELVCAGGRRP